MWDIWAKIGLLGRIVSGSLSSLVQLWVWGGVVLRCVTEGRARETVRHCIIKSPEKYHTVCSIYDDNSPQTAVCNNCTAAHVLVLTEYWDVFCNGKIHFPGQFSVRVNRTSSCAISV